MAKQFRIKNTMGHFNMPIDAKGNILYTAEEVDTINAQYNRLRISGNEMEQMIGFVAASNLLRQCAVQLSDFAKETGDLAFLKRISTQLKTAAVRLATRIEVRQMGAIISQTDHAKLTISAEYVPAMVNTDIDGEMWHSCGNVGFDGSWEVDIYDRTEPEYYTVTHWMPLPEPPEKKEE